MSQFTYISVGFHFNDPNSPSAPSTTPNLCNSFNECKKLGGDVSITTLTKPGYAHDEQGEIQPVDSDFILLSSSWNTQTMIAIQPCLVHDLDGDDEQKRVSAEESFENMYMWASHLELPSVYVPSPQKQHPKNLARLMKRCLNSSQTLTGFWLEIPLESRQTTDLSLSSEFLSSSENEDRQPLVDSWEMFDFIRSQCGSHSNLRIALKLPEAISPSTVPSSSTSYMSRWFSEPLGAIVIPTSAFPPNDNGFPSLYKTQRELLLRAMFTGGIMIIVSGSPSHRPADFLTPAQHKLLDSPPSSSPSSILGVTAPRPGEGIFLTQSPEPIVPLADTPHQAAYRRVLQLYKQYFSNFAQGYNPYTQSDDSLFQPFLPPGIDFHTEDYLTTYRDFLQTPLQPLQDTLHTHTYETFEKDEKKYQLYQQAVLAALITMPHLLVGWNSTKAAAFDPSRLDSVLSNTLPLLSLVLGAGRGPLVRCIYRAVTKANQIREWMVRSLTNQTKENDAKIKLFVQSLQPHFKIPTVSILASHLTSGRTEAEAQAVLVSLLSKPLDMFCVAVEKNDCALITLRSLTAANTEWPASRVQVRKMDMRSDCHNPPSTHPDQRRSAFFADAASVSDLTQLFGCADLIVTELLGSFGDNELSPECLDGGSRFLRMTIGHDAEHGKTLFLAPAIPCTSTSFLTPVSTPTLHQEIHNLTQSGVVQDKSDHEADTTLFQTPHVVKFHKHILLSDPARIFDFVHPSLPLSVFDSFPTSSFVGFLPFSQLNTHNERQGVFSFTATETGRCYGFSGYFMSVLFSPLSNTFGVPFGALANDAREGALATHLTNGEADPQGFILSTVPSTHSQGMYSWFPIYFPILNPFLVQKGQSVVVELWRKNSDSDGDCRTGKVWYEWQVQSPITSSIHNLEAKCSYVGK